MSISLKTLATIALLLVAASGSAKEPKCPLGAFLTVSGKIRNFTDARAKVYVVTEAELLRMPTSSIRTTTVWSPLTTYTGPSLRSLLELVGADPMAKQLHLIALDAFESWVPLSDVGEYEPVVAHSMDGQRISEQRFGPLYLVYPRDAHGELQTPRAESRFVWELCRVVVE